MLNNNHFYNRTIRKVVVSFGSLFNDLVLVRYSKSGDKEFERIRVPLSYGPKEKYITRLAGDPDLTNSVNAKVPRMSFSLTSVSYDSSRKVNTAMKNYAFDDSTGLVSSQYAPIPYNFDFELSIYVRNTEDGTQLLEQILPFFTPDYTLTVDFIPSLARKYDMPIILNSVDTEIDYEGDMSTTRLIIWNLTFTAKGYIFPPVKTGTDKLIKSANTNIFVSSSIAGQAQQVYVDTNTGFGVLVTGETIRTRDNTKTGTVVYFANNSTGSLVVSNMNEPLEENDIITGDYSNATYRIDNVDLNPLKTVVINVQPDPIDAKPDDDYGFTETIKEYPETLE